MGVIGARVRRLEDRALLTGSGRFVDDIALPGALHVAFVRSPHAHALIRSIDSAAARALSGVQAVLILADLAPVLAETRLPRQPEATRQPPGSTPFILAREEVAFVGEPVALVAAKSRAIAEDAAQLVAVEYERLQAVADCRRAIDPSAPKARLEMASNVLARFKVAYGDIDAAFRGAAQTVARDLFQHRGAGHPIECRGVAVEARAGDDALTVWASTQLAHELHHAIAEVLGIDENRLRVATPDVGGGFGPKYCVYQEEVAVAAAARLLRRPLQWIEDRREHFLTAIQERDQHWSMAIALEADGRIRGVRGTLLHDQGAYALKDVNLPYNCATSVTGPYIVPAFAAEVVIAQTNKVAASSVRGAGYPEACFAMERLIDGAAQALGLDRAELRRRNLIPPEKMPYEKPLKARSGASIVYDSGDYPACQAELLAAAGWDSFPARQRAAREAGRYLGIGLAHAVKGTGRGPFETGIVRIAPSGRVSVFTGAAAMGQGLATALAQICAEELGLLPEQVSVIAGDTSVAPLGLGGFASRQLVTAGSSVRLAARAVAAKAKALASHLLEADAQDLEFANGEVRIVGVPQRAIRLGEIARVLRGAPGYRFPPGIEPGLEANRPFMTDALAYANAFQIAEIEVDIETGEVKILAYHAIQDSGVLINPLIVEGQVQGGIAHGIGNALFERMGYDEEAQPVTTSFAEYLLPAAPELPRFATRYKQTPSPMNPLGAKGAGEVGTIPAAAATISAVEDALRPFGVRLDEAPLSPQRLVALIAGVRKAR
jgi:aerobic carbon-monoxide dehydrogenase large subunit